MCAEKNVAKTKALERAPIHQMKFNTYIEQIILKLAKDGFQICPVQPRFQRG